MNNLSSKAKAAITDANNSTGRLPVNAHGKDMTDADTIRELRDAGMIGANNGLTMRGRIARDRITEAALDAAF